MWDADRYLQFAADYSRPFLDMLAQIPQREMQTIVDLGCGPGDLTRRLAERWPDADIVGVDCSAEMLARAQSEIALSRLRFVRGDIATWTPERPVDLLVSNAALQWVGDHARLLPRLADLLAARGVLAVQMPDHFAMPVHLAIGEVISRPRWRDLLAHASVGLQPDTVKPLLWYVEQLDRLGFDVNAWHSTYVRIWRGDNPVLEWMKATALRPLLARLDAAQTPEFLREVGERFRAHYPKTGDVTFVPAKRLFFVASRRG